MLRVFTNHILPFAVAFFGGIATFYLLAPIGVPAPYSDSLGTSFSSAKSSRTCQKRGTGYGYGSGSGYGPGSGSFEPSSGTSKVEITSKPAARYTDAARANDVEGTVRLKVTMLASGHIGSITPVTRLPHGLTEQAIEAARQIRFEPKRVDGVPVSTVVTVDYNFDIY